MRLYLKCLDFSKKKQHQQHLYQQHLLNWQHFFKKGTFNNINSNIRNDIFLFRTNEMRLNITKVLDRIANQLQKSSMLDDPIKLIYSVMHSNDCIARALALRFVFLSSECFIHYLIY